MHLSAYLAELTQGSVLQLESLIHVVMASKTKHRTSRSKNSSAGNQEEEAVCQLCEKVIVESDGTCVGEDAIFCEGQCKCWLHRWCAGLTKPAFDRVKSSSEPFSCQNCTVQKMAEDIVSLNKQVQGLLAKVTSTPSAANPSTVHPSQSKEITSLKSSVRLLNEDMAALKQTAPLANRITDAAVQSYASVTANSLSSDSIPVTGQSRKVVTKSERK